MTSKKSSQYIIRINPRLADEAVKSYDFLGKKFPIFPGFSNSAMVIDDPEMGPTLKCVGEISSEFCNETFKQHVFNNLKGRKLVGRRFEPDKIYFPSQVIFCKKHLTGNDTVFLRYEVENMLDTSFLYGAYAGKIKV
jgi:hypothetical protein